MKKIILVFTVSLAMLSYNVKSQTNSIKVSSTGLVGINLATPLYQLDISGSVRMANNGYTVLFNGAYIAPTGSIDLGTSGAYWYRLYATSAWFTNQPVIGSDLDFKTNITELTLMKDKLKLLRPVSYNLKTDFKGLQTDSQISNLQYGFIAQELQKVFPDMVTTRDDGILGIRYNELIPVLVQALKEQQEAIDSLNIRITVLEKTSK